MKKNRNLVFTLISLFLTMTILLSGCNNNSSSNATNITPSIVITTPTANTVIPGGKQDYVITWTGTGIAPKKNLEYSLNNGTAWTLFDAINANVNSWVWKVPNVSSTQALIRITDSSGLRGLSGTFTITATDTLTVGEMDAKISGTPFKASNAKTINGNLTATVTASIPKQSDASLDSVAITLFVAKQGIVPYTLDLTSDANSLINYCIKSYPGGTCNNYTAKKGTGTGTIIVTSLTPIIEGTFSGSLQGGSASLTITNGAFKAQLN